MFDYMRNNGVEFQAYWNVESAGGGSHRLWPESETNLDDAGQAFRDEVLVDLGESSSDGGTDGGTDTETPSDTETPTGETLGGYNQPSPGTLDWHVPLNENFSDIEADIKSLDQRLSDLE
jgi:hypothetical protein